MALTYKAQMTLSFFIIIFSNLLTDIFDIWIYRSIGWCICGLLLLVHPVVPKGMDTNKQTLFWTRVAGVIIILIGVFTRVHYS